MQRGPGVCQRRILARVALGTPFYLTELLPLGMPPNDPKYVSTYQALWRACMTLWDQNRLDAIVYGKGTPSRLLVLPDGPSPPGQRPADPRSEFLLVRPPRPNTYGPPLIAPESRLRLRAEERHLIDAGYVREQARFSPLFPQEALVCRLCCQWGMRLSSLDGSRTTARRLIAHVRSCAQAANRGADARSRFSRGQRAPRFPVA